MLTYKLFLDDFLIKLQIVVHFWYFLKNLKEYFQTQNVSLYLVAQKLVKMWIFFVSQVTNGCSNENFIMIY
jgi:hypothetical protein